MSYQVGTGAECATFAVWRPSIDEFGIWAGILVEMAPPEITEYLGAKMEGDGWYEDIKVAWTRPAQSRARVYAYLPEIPRSPESHTGNEEQEEKRLNGAGKGGAR